MKENNSKRQVYFNGEFVPETEARVSIYDSALMFGDMVFEMTRSFNGKQFKLKEHLKRLYSGIKILRIPLKLKIEEMEKAVHETVEKNLGLMVVLMVVAISFGGLVQIVPLFFQPETTEPVEGLHHLERRHRPTVDGDAVALLKIHRDVLRLVRRVLGRHGQLEHPFVFRRECVEINVL